SGEECAKLLREARITAAISHPNVCSILDIHQSEERAFLVMEYVDGQSLRKLIESGPLEPSKAAGISIQVTEGLRAAHRKGFVHRDIKPENILITNEGVAKITDFGLARKAERSTESGEISGT